MAKHTGLKRVLGLYGLIERMHLSESQMALGAVLEVDRAAHVEEQSRGTLLSEGRQALRSGDNYERSLAEYSSKVCTERILRLAEMRVQREQMRERSRDTHRESRLKLEQVKRVLERAMILTEVEDGRRTQAVSDDRYGSRREWMLAKAIREQALDSSHRTGTRFGH